MNLIKLLIVFVKEDLFTKSYRIRCINNDSISTINDILLN